MAAMQEFLDDYDPGRMEGRYVDAELPTLPFADAAFDLALCSHFLFLYTEPAGRAVPSIGDPEMARVAAEVRIFPLLDVGGAPRRRTSRRRLASFGTAGYDVSIEDVPVRVSARRQPDDAGPPREIR